MTDMRATERWICDACNEPEPCACCRSSETHMRRYHADVTSDEAVDFDKLAALPKAVHTPQQANPDGLFGF